MQVALVAPPLDKLRPVLDRLRNVRRGASGTSSGMCPVDFEMDSRGYMALSVRSDVVSAKSFFKGLKSAGLAQEGSQTVSSTATVDSRILCRTLHALGVELQTVLVGITPGVALMLYCVLASGMGNVTVLLSHVSTGGDDADQDRRVGSAAAAAAV